MYRLIISNHLLVSRQDRDKNNAHFLDSSVNFIKRFKRNCLS